MKRTLTVAVLAAAATAFAAGVEGPGGPAEPEPYRSALADYQADRPLELAPWREVNDAMGRLGGHMGHLGRGEGRPPIPAPEATAPGQGAQPR